MTLSRRLEHMVRLLIKLNVSPGQVAQLIGALSCTLKGHGFDSQSGYNLGCGFDPQWGHV